MNEPINPWSGLLHEGTWLCGGEADVSGTCVVTKRHDAPRAIVCFAPASHSRFARHAGLPEAALTRSWAIEAVWLAHGGSLEDDLAPALYRALTAGRVQGASTVVAHVEHLDTLLSRGLRLAELKTGKPEPSASGALMATAQMLDIAIHHASEACSAQAWREVQPHLALEVVETIKHWVQGFYKGSWSRSIFEGTMTREQYVQSLSNMHHYVRQTTQHLGRAVASADNRELRRHFIEHLNGEINHEVIIEHDLRHLGVDPEYVMKHRVPNPATKAFMAIQETTIAFYQDPILLMACPLAAEGITANMPDSFVPALRKLVASWGVPNPERATAFLTSHQHADGGDDGHWQMTIEMLNGYLVDEATQRRFLCTLRTAADCIERSFNSNIEELPLFFSVA